MADKICSFKGIVVAKKANFFIVKIDSTDIDFFPTPIGKGYGIDLGFTMAIKKRFKFGLSVNNIGFINYVGNLYTLKDTLFDEFNADGIENLKAISIIKEFVKDDGFISWSGKEKKNNRITNGF